ncbi:hypothetical protein [Dietzia cinnamea]|uniref:hypothetical protein n=1 Tax=Dietzia cinnamea TaxID=321318 RepID=UPI00223BD878|nr:hypothetical protein [Dietzia cinnamea]MCT2077451.1 hypothetical protein [Dietzia cinnamea]MCT2221310.1 hypothetical protein [Dietzia cinnamea]
MAGDPFEAWESQAAELQALAKECHRLSRDIAAHALDIDGYVEMCVREASEGQWKEIANLDDSTIHLVDTVLKLRALMKRLKSAVPSDYNRNN